MYTATRGRSLVGAVLVILAFTIGGALANPKPSFVWGFGGFSGTDFPECGKMPITIGTLPSITTAPVPPYTLISYEVGGIATAQNLGSDPSNTVWTVDHNAGAQLLMSMTDSVGNSGGISKFIYNVVSNATTSSSCHPTNATSSVSLTANTTSSLNTCDVLSLKVSGGTRPYQVTLVSTLDYIVINVTMKEPYDIYNWVNKASPNSSLIATVSDATGAYAVGTGIFKTAGGLDHSCNGMRSTLLDSTGHEPPLQADNTTSTAPSGSNSKSSTGSIVGGVIGGLVFIGALAGGVMLCLRRRARARNYPDDHDHVSGQQSMTAITPFRPDSYTDSPLPTPGLTPYTPFGDSAPPSGTRTKHSPITAAPQYPTLGPSTPAPQYPTLGPSTAAPQYPVLGSSAEPLASGSGGVIVNPDPALDVQGEQTGKRSRRPPAPPEQRQTVYQHADISDVLELPPAYRDRAAPGT